MVAAHRLVVVLTGALAVTLSLGTEASSQEQPSSNKPGRIVTGPPLDWRTDWFGPAARRNSDGRRVHSRSPSSRFPAWGGNLFSITWSASRDAQVRAEIERLSTDECPSAVRVHPEIELLRRRIDQLNENHLRFEREFDRKHIITGQIVPRPDDLPLVDPKLQSLRRSLLESLRKSSATPRREELETKANAGKPPLPPR